MRRPGTSFPALLALLVATVLAIAPATAPAQAATGSGHDPAGDAPAQLDLLRMKVSNGERNFVVKLYLTELAPRRTSAYAVISSPGGARPYYVAGWTQAKGEESGTYFYRFDDDGMKRVRCRGKQVRLSGRADRLTIRIPQRCLRATPDRVWVSAITETRAAKDADDISPVRVGRGPVAGRST